MFSLSWTKFIRWYPMALWYLILALISTSTKCMHIFNFWCCVNKSRSCCMYVLITSRIFLELSPKFFYSSWFKLGNESSNSIIPTIHLSFMLHWLSRINSKALTCFLRLILPLFALIMRVNLNGEQNSVGKVFTIITISLAIGLNFLVLVAWLIWSKSQLM